MQNQKTKIVHMTSGHRPFDVRVFHKECKSLSTDGYDVTLITPHDKDEIVDSVKVKGIKKAKTRFERMSITTWRVFFRAIKIKAVLYHFHDPELMIIGLLLKLLGKKVIYDAHEDYPLSMLDNKLWIPKPLRKIASLTTRLIEAICGHVFDKVVCVTDKMGYRFPKNKVQVIHNYPIIEDASNKSPKPYSTRSNFALYIGVITVDRGLFKMVESIGLVNDTLDCKLVLGGKLDDSTIQKLSKFQGWKRVSYRGWLNREEIRNILNDSKIGLNILHPTLQFYNYVDNSVKIFEYLANKIPVIGSNYPVYREFFEPIGCMKFVDPLNPREIADAIQWLLDNPVEAEAMGERGYQAVMNKYNWEIESKKLLSMYERILHL